MKISALNVFPLKSARGLALAEAYCGPMGLSGDRIAVIADRAGNAITQRDMPPLARLSVTPSADGLRLSMEGKGEIEAVPAESRSDIRVWSDTVNAADAADAVNAMLSNWFDRDVALHFFDGQSNRTASRDFVPRDTPVSFADGFQILVTTTGSLAALNDDLESHGAATVGMERFRPNIVIDCDEAWAEDGWESIAIGDIVLDLVKPCARCIMTTQDQTTGSREIANPLPALGRLRMSADRRAPGPLFGWNAVPRGEGLLKVGDTVTITASRSERWPLKQRRA
ncbi:MOSC domain-containing protein [Martelella endophytica]|uniref:Molybdenum cofactor sulfurase n=1 Tax=Martelella endophytica TaxID=1486262 RepID=A0A0D5LS49_MAREN|nr:MOSC N-terminal beta barrel domain-containing protein [Martelella endophytica]AJY46607.1 molybdenum cofactor sulfurase [Martelella endophytica]